MTHAEPTPKEKIEVSDVVSEEIAQTLDVSPDETEEVPEVSPEDAAEHWSAIEAFQMVQEVLMDEDPDVERDDLWQTTWKELHTPVEGYMDMSEEIRRHGAINEIHSLYLKGLEELYPELMDAESTEDRMLQMMMIPDLPECDGHFTSTEYETPDGVARAMVHTQANLGDHGVVMCVNVMEDDHGFLKTYTLIVGLKGNLFGGVGIAYGRDAEEMEMLQRVHPSQISNLSHVLGGNLRPADLEMKLTEIRVASEEDVDEYKLNEIIDEARERYHMAVAERTKEAESGFGEMELEHLEDMQRIALERMKQLDL